MTNRREFLQIGITATAWPLASTAAQAAADLGSAAPLALYKVIYDTRFAASIAFAERAAALRLPVHAIDGDMTRLWYHELYYRWKQGPAAIAGLTAHGALFCFEQLARDQGMRLVFRAQHSFAADDAVEHELEGPLLMLGDALALDSEGARWPACMAEVLAHCPQGRAEISRAAATTVIGAGGRAASEPLYSWVFAPALKVGAS